jgi:hypothetical protein
VLALPTRPALALYGLWQSEEYFRDVGDVLRADLQPRPGPFPELERQMRQTESVAVHIRRGDYLTAVGRQFGFVGLDYYQRAIADLRADLASPHFYVFSDDIDWVACHLRVDAPHTLVRPDGGSEPADHEDFRLMRACRHFIVANSTFSWWAAWLADGPGKIVIAPRRWYRDDPEGHLTRDLLPSGWMLR